MDGAYDRMIQLMAARQLLGPDNAALLMVSGGSDSTALVYLMARAREAGLVGPLAMLHVNHKLRGADADADAVFVEGLARMLGIPCFVCEVDVAGEAARSGGNVEAVARRERYLAADEALASMCHHEFVPLLEGRIVTAHTADDRIESFYMRSIVGTGPGGFRSMKHRNGPVVRPLLGCTREELRQAIEGRAASGLPTMRGAAGELWREDATNAHTDRFRAYVRHELVPVAQGWNAQMPATLSRTMDLIADEDDMLEGMATAALREHVVPADAAGVGPVAAGGAGETAHVGGADGAPDMDGASVTDGTNGAGGANGMSGADGADVLLDEAALANGFRLLPSFVAVGMPLQRRAVHRLLRVMLGAGERIDTAAVEAVLAAFRDGVPHSGYTANIQGDLAVSSNKRGVLVEPMAVYRRRRKRA